MHRRHTPTHDIVGRNFSRISLQQRQQRSTPSRPVAGVLAGLLIAGLGLAALRIDILRLRYALAEAVAEEKSLLEERRVWNARETTLADPARLAKIAEERGFAAPTQQIDLRNVRVASGQP